MGRVNNLNVILGKSINHLNVYQHFVDTNQGYATQKVDHPSNRIMCYSFHFTSGIYCLKQGSGGGTMMETAPSRTEERTNERNVIESKVYRRLKDK